MATITGLTAERMLAIEDASVVDGAVIGENLILYQHDGTQIDAGSVRGPAGPMGPNPGSEGSILFTAPGPTVTWSDILKFRTDANGKLEWGNGINPVDVSLYRNAANVLRTDDSLIVDKSVQVDFDDLGTGLLFGSAADVNLYRHAANILRTDDALIVDKSVHVDYDNLGTGILFGSAGDTTLYRDGANRLRTGGEFIANGMYVEKHPYTGPRHIESNQWDLASLAQGATTYIDIAFTNAFGSTPSITFGLFAAQDGGNAQVAPAYVWISSVTTTGFRIYCRNGTNGTVGFTIFWHAEGPD